MSSDLHWTGTGLDDGPALQAAITKLSAIGARLVLHGLVLVDTQIVLPNTGAPVVIHLAAGCEVRANITGDHAVFLANSVVVGGAPPGGTVTLTGAGAVVGATSVTVNAVNGLVAGNAIAIVTASSDHIETHIVRSTGTGVLHFTEPVEVPVAAGSEVLLLPGLACVRITGDPGSKLTGRAEECIQIMGGRYCHIEGITIAMALTGSYPWPLYFDWGTRDSRIRDVHIVADATSPGTTGVGLEGCTNVVVEHVSVDQSAGTFGAAFECTNASNVWFVECSAPGGNIGIVFEVPDSGGAWDGYGPRGSGAIGCKFSDNDYGFIVRNGGQGVHLLGCSAPRSAIAGVYINAADTGVFPNDVHVVGGDFTASAGNAIMTFGGSGHHFTGFDGSGSVTALHVAGGNVVADAFLANGCTGAAGAVCVAGGDSAIRLANFQAQGATCYALYVVDLGASTDVTVQGADLTGSGTVSGNGCAYLYAGRVLLRDVVTGFRADPGAIVSYGIVIGGAADVTLENVLVLLPSSPSGAWVGLSLKTSTATARLRGFRVDSGGVTGVGVGASYGVITNAAGTVLHLGGVDVSQATVPWLLTSGTKANFSPASSSVITLSGTSAVVVSTANQGIEPTFDADWPVVFTLASISLTPNAGLPYVSATRGGSPPTFSVKGVTVGTVDLFSWRALA